jgi:hypothetical protein
MGMRQMTFEIPDEVAEDFIRDVPTAEQSAYVTKLLVMSRPTPELTDVQWDAICEAVNNDPDIAQLEPDMDALSGDGLDEYPWDEPASR